MKDLFLIWFLVHQEHLWLLYMVFKFLYLARKFCTQMFYFFPVDFSADEAPLLVHLCFGFDIGSWFETCGFFFFSQCIYRKKHLYIFLTEV